MTVGPRVGTTLVLALLALASGCAAPAHRPAASAASAAGKPAAKGVPISNADRCATRLHDLCGPLLLYYATNHKLPPTLEALRSTGMDMPEELVCPVSHQPYLYNPGGLLAPGGMGKLIIYDATPAHSGMRWAVAIIEPQRQIDPLVAKVVAVPNTSFPK